MTRILLNLFSFWSRMTTKDKTSTATTYSYSLIPWLSLFLLLKVTTSQLAAWSWWWIFLPVYPTLSWVLGKLGWI